MKPESFIRPAIVNDVDVILELIRELADYERLLHEVQATHEGLQASLFGLHPAAHAVIAEVGGDIAGFALYFFNYSTFLGKRGLYLEDLYVRPVHRGNGVGRALLAHLASTAVGCGCGRMEWAVLDWNAPARAFYDSIGATPMDSWLVNRLTGADLRRLAETNAAS
jgi:GNAT superfamily N-acetyltransferase